MRSAGAPLGRERLSFGGERVRGRVGVCLGFKVRYWLRVEGLGCRVGINLPKLT